MIPEPSWADTNVLILRNALLPIDVTESGTDTDVNLVRENALLPIDVTDDGITTLDNIDALNASAGIEVIDKGIVTAVTAEFAKAPVAIDVAPVLSDTEPVQPVFPVMTPAAIV